MSNRNVASTLASAVAAVSLTFSANAIADTADISDNIQNKTQVEHPALVEIEISDAAWADARKRSDRVKALSERIKASDGKMVPKSLRRAVTSNPAGGPIDRRSFSIITGEFLRRGHVGTVIGAVVEPFKPLGLNNSYDGHKHTREVLEMARRVVTDKSDYGANISRVFMVQQDKNAKDNTAGLESGDIIVSMGNYPDEVFKDIESAEKDLSNRFEWGLHITPDEEYLATDNDIIRNGGLHKKYSVKSNSGSASASGRNVESNTPEM